MRLVFLNGCSTADQVEVLRNAGIPAVIATTEGIDDAVATEFAKGFYASLADDHDLRTAFHTAESVVNSHTKRTPPPDLLASRFHVA